ncbi:translation initiation factor 1 (eIF-1/SUI1) [[Leptolyngbya] sp. PCC 7376]|uniref:translation initiation factor n=1 Tax=[Leptolyngbya] sp. PCC 7376 TaxID=111781 RepID=UPI00029EC629|nr:translation initiation factor [[Leptolyngbya] sp. PCC 7376]AFY39180.1 translation initiation factor 1 (eIF-1/SUI1) [[Leptolyngbya] sp. PCC 7376]
MARKKIVYQEFGSAPETETPEIVDLPPNQQNIRIQSTRSGRKGKTVTVITGFQHAPATLTKLTKQLKNKCGAGGTLKDGVIEIQGDRRKQLLELLTQQGYKAKISGG